MRQLLLFGLILPISACTSADLTQVKTETENAIRASSGAVMNVGDTVRDAGVLGRQVIDRAKEGIDGLRETSKQVEEGIDQVKGGIETLKDKGKLIEGIIHGQSASAQSSAN